MFKLIVVLFLFLFYFQSVITDCIKDTVPDPGSQDCVNQSEDASPYYQQLGDHVTLISRHCSPGQFVTDHLENDTGLYTIIGHSHNTTITINGFEDGGIYRFYCNGSTSYCYINIAVYPDLDSVVLKVSKAVVGRSFNAACTATGFPAPKVDIHLCQLDVMPVSTLVVNNTRRVSISIELPANCSAVSCFSYPINCTERINLTNIEVTTATSATTTASPANLTGAAINITTSITVTSSSTSATVSVVRSSTSNGATTGAINTIIIMPLGLIIWTIMIT